MEVGVDFLAVAERFLPGLGVSGPGLRGIWAPACQDSSHVGNAGSGVNSMKGAPLAPPTSATVQFKRFFDYGRVVRCMLPLGLGGSCIWLSCTVIRERMMMMLSSLFFDAALGELSIVARGTWSPPKSLAWQKGFRLGAGLILRKLGL